MKRESGSADQRISGSADRRISGSAERRISGAADRRISGDTPQLLTPNSPLLTRHSPLLSLRTRLTLSFLAVIVVTAGVIVLLTNRITAERFTTMVSAGGRAYAQRLAPTFAAYYAQTGSWEGVEALLADYNPTEATASGNGGGGRGGMMQGAGGNESPRGMHGMMYGSMMSSTIERILILDANDRVVADSDPQAAFSLTPAVLSKSVPLTVNGQQVGALIVASALGDLNAGQHEFLQQVNRLVLLTATLAGLAVLVIGHFEARRLTAPVRALAAAAHRIAAGDLTQRIPPAGAEELVEMATAFNTMAARLEEQQSLRHRAMADIAHELRTPLSVLQIDLESLEDGLVEPTPSVIAGLQIEVVHLKRLVEDLRTLSLADAGELRVELQPLDAGELAHDVAGRVQTAARERGITLTVNLPDAALPVQGDPQRLAQVLLNLLTNALHYTPAGGVITVSATRQGQEVWLSVSDTGAGIHAADLPYVFERFYRADPSRAQDNGGSGLGLAIVRSLVAVHGGRVWAASREGQGSTFTVALPLTPTPLGKP